MNKGYSTRFNKTCIEFPIAALVHFFITYIIHARPDLENI